MTSAPVKNAADVIYVARKDGTPSPKGENSFAGNLKSAVEKNGNAPKASDTDRKEKAVKKTDDVRAEKVSPDRSEPKKADPETPVKNEADSAETKLADDKPEAVNEKIDSLMKRIEKVMGVDEEELLHAMENLGITGALLFVPENMTDLLMELTGTEDPMALVTDEDLFASLKDLNMQASELMEQLQEAMGLSPEDMQKIMDQVVKQEQDMQPVSDEGSDDMQAVKENLNVTVAKTVETEEVDKTADQTEDAEELIPGNEAVNADSVKEESNETSEGEYGADDQKSAFAETDFSKEDVQVKETDGKERISDGHRVIRNETQPVNNQTVLNTGNPIPQDDLQAVQEERMISYTDRTADTQRIADQIMEHMRVQLREGVTELEMQLHPASLGNVNVSLVSREGNITAQFFAQNEAVKNVIETQIVQLKEQFEEQGIKVEAVEVAVSDHQFEHRSDGEEHREFRENGGRAKRTRRINLDTLSDEEISRLTEDADKIQVDMMNRNGNTVDYTV